MKRYTVTLIASLVVALVGLLAGCTNERLLEQGSVPDPVGPGQYVTFGVRVGLDTYSVPAEDYEKAVESVQALLFDADGKYLATPTLKPIPGKSAEYGFQCRETGSLKMLLVANHTFTASDLQGKTLTEVGKLLVNKTEPGTANEFVMASDAKDLTITAGQETKAGTIALTRLAARIDIQTTLDKLVLTKVTMKGRKVQSTLLASADTKAHTSATKVYDTFTVFGKKSSSASMGQIYGFENTQAGSEPGGTTLEIEATFDGLKIKPVTVKLPALQRNHIYSLQLINDKKEYDPTKDKLTYVLTVLDWNAGPVLRLTEKELQRIMADQLAGTSYTISVTSEASKGTFLSADGFTASVIPVVTKKVEVKGVTISSEEIKGQDKFTYKLKYATLGTDYVTIDAQGQYVVQSNPTYSNRRFAFDVVWKDSPDKANPVRMEYILEQSGQPISTAPDGVLSQMAEWNVKSDGSWDKDHTIPTSLNDRTYLMNWDTAMALDMPTGYHLPSTEELHSVFPPSSQTGIHFNTNMLNYLTSPVTISDRSTTVFEGGKAKVGGEPATEVKSQFAYEQDVTYALRYIGTKHESAWKYESVKIGGKQMLRITSVGLKDFKGTVLDVKAHASILFASSDRTVRLLPCSGNQNGAQGVDGCIWSSQQHSNAVNAYCSSFGVSGCSATFRYKSDMVSVRPFVGEQKVRFNTQKDQVLSRMAEYNLKSDGTWDKAHTIPTSMNDQTYLMDWWDAMSVSLPSGFHIPMFEEMQLVFPLSSDCVRFNSVRRGTYPAITGRHAVVSEKAKRFKLGDDIFDDVKSQFAYDQSDVTYALRFIGTKYESAWKYEYTIELGKTMLCITAVGLKDFKGTVLDVSKHASTLFASSDATVRLLPAAGTSTDGQGSRAGFWTCTEQNENNEFIGFFNSVHAYLRYGKRGTALSLRPFSGLRVAPVDD